MIRSLNRAEQAMLMEQTRINALANNLANVNSTGFRQILTRVAEAGTEGNKVAAGNDIPLPDDALPRENPKSGAPAGDNELVMYHAVDVRPGAVSATGRETDLALMDKGFFVIQTDDGERYTRSGSFRLDEQRRLVTPQGEAVVGSGGALKVEGSSFSIATDGTLMVDGAQAGRVKIVNFSDPTLLEHMGNNLLKAPEEMAAEELPTTEVILAQGHLEGSNVNPIDTLVAMIAAQRAFEVQTKVMTTEDEMLSKTVNNLPRVG